MMTGLAAQQCTACRADAPRVGDDEARALLQDLPGWQIREVEGVPRLEKRFAFRNFAAALEFANRVGAIAEAENHHPLLAVEWGGASVAWWTHKIRGLHRNDFIMAARTEELGASSA